MPKLYYLFITLLLSLSTAYAQDTAPKQIEIVYAGTLTIDNDKYPGATIFNSDDQRKVQFRHQGMDIWCDVAVRYQKTNQVKAFGDVFIQQGDSLKMNSNFVEYNGDTKIALAKENVKLRNEKMTLETQELFFDRNTQEAYYLNHGKISDEENVLTSKEGRYFVAPKKSQFSSQVNITNADFQINSLTLDYYHSTGHVYMFGPTTITGKDYIAYGEKGFYDTKTEKGYFMDMARIDYDNKRLTGDSLYFDKFRNFASATNNIIIRDTINHTLVKGHYGEIHKAQDSMFITKKALIASLVDKDSVYIHAKRIMVTGKTGARIVRAYTGARIYKTDIQGKCDSIHSSQTTGLTQLIGKPILWSGKSQMTGDHIQLLANTQTEKLDSLRVFDNAFLIEKDTLGEGYNQVKGKTLKGKFKENKLNNVNLYQNTEVIYYVYDDQNNPAGINKSKCSQIRVDFATNQQIETVIFYKDVDGGIYPEDKINKEELRFPNFNWRGDEIILSKNDIFPEEEKNIQLTPIKGIKTEEIDLIEEKLNPKIEN